MGIEKSIADEISLKQSEGKTTLSTLFYSCFFNWQSAGESLLALQLIFKLRS